MQLIPLDNTESYSRSEVVPTTSVNYAVCKPGRNKMSTFNFPPISGIDSLFAGVNIGEGSNININFNAGQYNATQN